MPKVQHQHNAPQQAPKPPLFAAEALDAEAPYRLIWATAGPAAAAAALPTPLLIRLLKSQDSRLDLMLASSCQGTWRAPQSTLEAPIISSAATLA